jgi:UDP-3-O-[3-hydroxymyristoyl] glucosamine N-acyltransferase
MNLSEVNVDGLIFYRNGSFRSLGFVGDKKDALLTFIETENFISILRQKLNITAGITTPELAELIPDHIGVMCHFSPKRAFYECHSWLCNETTFYKFEKGIRISQTAKVHPTAIIEDGATIGEEAHIEAYVVVGRGVRIGDRSIIRSGSKIGGEGFEFKRWNDKIYPVPHTGTVVIGADVEVQHNCVIDRSVFGGETFIGDFTKIDNMVHVAHNCSIGCRCLIAASAVISGSVVIGDDVWVGPGAVISNGITIGSRAQIVIGSVVIKSVLPDLRAVGRAIGHTSEALEIKTQT